MLLKGEKGPWDTRRHVVSVEIGTAWGFSVSWHDMASCTSRLHLLLATETKRTGTGLTGNQHRWTPTPVPHKHLEPPILPTVTRIDDGKTRISITNGPTRQNDQIVSNHPSSHSGASFYVIMLVQGKNCQICSPCQRLTKTNFIEVNGFMNFVGFFCRFSFMCTLQAPYA